MLKENTESPIKFERVFNLESSGELPEELREKFAQVPILAFGNWSQDQLVFHLRWKGGYESRLEPNIREAVRKEYLQHWRTATAGKKEKLDILKEGFKELPNLRELDEEARRKLEQIKMGRRKIMPFPGLVMTFEELEEESGKVVINTRVGNYFELYKSNPAFMANFPGHEESLQLAIRGMATSIITETNDGYHIFSVKASGLSFGGYIGTPGMTPNLSDQQIRSFVEETKRRGTNKKIEIPGNWFFKLVEDDISEPNELNLEPNEIDDLRFIGANSDEVSGWMNLNFFCKLNVSSAEIERRFSHSPSHEYATMIFAKNNPQSLAIILSRPNMYFNMFGGYRAYFQLFHPEVLNK